MFIFVILLDTSITFNLGAYVNIANIAHICFFNNKGCECFYIAYVFLNMQHVLMCKD